jgi:hypothetical protein
MIDALATLRNLPRLRLAQLPTALEPMPRLGAALGIASLYVKRDDCTGLGPAATRSASSNLISLSPWTQAQT